MRKDGTVATDETIASPVVLEGRRVVYVMALDLAERLRAEEALKESEARFHDLFEFSGDPIVVHDGQVVLFANRAAIEVFGLPPSTAPAGSRIRQFFEPESWELAASRMSALFGVPAELLSKPAKLTTLEEELVRTHVESGYEIVLSAAFGGGVAEIVRQHHERIDGSGYPRGLHAEDLLPSSKVLMVADVVEAMSSHRPYRPSLGREAAVEEVVGGRGTAYDAEVADACVAVLAAGFDFEDPSF